jgi:hypothetical protein
VDVDAKPDMREPGYCVYGCGFHMVTPVPGRSGGVCGNCEQAGRADLPPAPDRPPYAPRISWWQSWRLQRTAADFWGYGDNEEPGPSFGAFFTSAGGWRYWFRVLLQRLGSRS